MNDNSDFFFNAAITISQSTKLFGYSSLHTGEYERSLHRSLKIAFPPEVEYLSLEWKSESRVFNGNSVDFSFIYLRCQEKLYRICLLVIEDGAVLFSNCLPAVFAACSQWLTAQFDTIIKRITLTPEHLEKEFSSFIQRSRGSRVPISSSELVYSFNMPELKRITVSVPGTDIDELDQHDTLGSLYEYLKRHTAIDFTKLHLSRVNCEAFVMTGNGKLKLFRHKMTDEQMWDIIANILYTAQSKK